MEEEKGGSYKGILIVMLLIVVIAIIVGGALYVRSLPGGDPDATYEPIVITEEPEEFNNVISEEMDSYEGDINTDAIQSLVLRYNDKESNISFRYEFYVSGSSVLFSGWCLDSNGEEVRCSDKKISSSRLKDVTEIIERYVVADRIKKFIENTDSQYQDDDEIGALEIVLTDGRHGNFGYPNGAGNAVAKYCKNLTAWLDDSAKNE